MSIGCVDSLLMLMTILQGALDCEALEFRSVRSRQMAAGILHCGGFIEVGAGPVSTVCPARVNSPPASLTDCLYLPFSVMQSKIK